MEGFLHIRIRPWLRRLITRFIAIVPAVIVIGIKGEHGSYDLLILSQVILSLQLPFAIIPLIQLTSDRNTMGSFANKTWVKVLAWITALVIVGLNAKLVAGTVSGWFEDAGENAFWLWVTVVPVVAVVFLLLLYITMPKSWRMRRKEEPTGIPVLELPTVQYRRIGVAIDHSETDGRVLAHASMLAKQNNADVFLFHIVESVSVQLFGKEADDQEARSDMAFIHEMARQMATAGLKVESALGYGRVATELVNLAESHKVDLLIMGGHRHRGLRDLIFGSPISKVRHQLKIPVLVV